MKLLRILFLFLVLTEITHAQTNRTISGYVTDASSGEPIYLAKIYDTISKKGTISNEYGFYSLTIPAQDAVLKVTYIGMHIQFIDAPASLSELSISLEPSVQNIQEVNVNAEGSKKSTEETNSGTIELSLDKVDKLPVFLGEKDVIKTLQLMPGVSSGGEGSSGLYVRGGSPDQNLILLDGVPVYNASHLFGFFSVFNNDALSKVTMIKGGFPARFGGRASSVLDMHMKEGNTKNYYAQGSVGLIASRLMVEGPIVKEKSGFIISARRTYLDLLIRPFMDIENEGAGGYHFYDFNAKTHYKINDKHHLYLSGYFGKDKAAFKYRGENTYNGTTYKIDNEEYLGWGNGIGALRWNYRLGPKIFMNTTLTYSKYEFALGFNGNSEWTENGETSKEAFEGRYFSNINDWSLKSDFTYVPNSNHYIKFGAGDIYHTFKPGVFTTKEDFNGEIDEASFGSDSLYANELSAYIEDDHRINDWLKINYGLHLSGFLTKNKGYAQLQPRVSGNAALNDHSSIKFSYARSAQYIHLLSNTGIGLPTDLWVPATAKIKPITSDQLSVGYNYIIGKKYNFMVEGYYKTLNNVIQYKEGASFLGISGDWQDKVEIGKGWAYGAEFFLEKKVGKLTGWLGYTLSWATRQFDNINGGEIFPYTYDRRHDISVALTYEINETWDFGAVFVYNTGRAVSLPTSQISSADNPIISNSWHYQSQLNYLNNINGYRMPNYHRMDIGFNHHKKKKWGESIWSFSIYNVYNRQNAYYLYTEYNADGTKSLMQVSIFPIIPAFSWQFKLTELNKK